MGMCVCLKPGASATGFQGVPINRFRSSGFTLSRVLCRSTLCARNTPALVPTTNSLVLRIRPMKIHNWNLSSKVLCLVADVDGIQRTHSLNGGIPRFQAFPNLHSYTVLPGNGRRPSGNRLAIHTHANHVQPWRTRAIRSKTDLHGRAGMVNLMRDWWIDHKGYVHVTHMWPSRQPAGTMQAN